MAAPTKPLPIPMRDPVVNADSGRFSRTWTNYIDDLNSTVATISVGVVDGSDATAGQIGEYLTASGAGVPLGGSGTPTNVATIDLTPGDWDVSGNVAFAPSGGATAAISAGVNATSATFGVIFTHVSGSLGTGVGQRVGTGGPVRINLTVSTTVYLVASASLSSGGVTASGEIWARRAR